MLNFDSIMINSEQPKVLADFYSKAFDRAPDWEQDEWYGFNVGVGTIAIGPHSEVKGGTKEPARLMFNVSTKDPRAEFERMKNIGATVIAEPYEASDDSGSMVLSTLADPDGNYFQITSIWDDPDNSKS